MSRTVITEIVIPVISDILADVDSTRFPRYAEIRDECLMEYFEEEMQRWFGVIGADGCQHLREKLEEAKKRDPVAFEQLIKELLTKYVKLRIKLRQAKETRKEMKGPPDRFLELRRKYTEIVEKQRE